jgi:phosphoribosyl-ATP pyrophosphohydrolase/phosphoribosyl-AMP cyclohydrolase
MPWLEEIKFNVSGLVPVVTQEAVTGEVLMLAFANRQALETTASTGKAYYWSRSRQELWQKGQTSGHVQDVVEIRVDCDGDAVLYRVRQTGPACHTLRKSCFFRLVEDGKLHESALSGNALSRVDGVIGQRLAEPVEGSYTNYLFAQGLDKILKKVGEEATEVVVASKNEDNSALTGEVADLFDHVMVLLQERKLPLDAVMTELDARFGKEAKPLGRRSRNVEP